MPERPFNPPAFPCEAQGDRSVPQEHDHIQVGVYSSKFPGMSLRDWFAGQAVSGNVIAGATTREIAEWAYEVADEMLAARND